MPSSYTAGSLLDLLASVFYRLGLTAHLSRVGAKATINLAHRPRHLDPDFTPSLSSFAANRFLCRGGVELGSRSERLNDTAHASEDCGAGS